jgi:hypothetical protein
MTTQKSVLFALIAILVVIASYLVLTQNTADSALGGNALDATPKDMTLSGTYTCLPHMDTSGPQTMECAFGLKTDDGDYYAVNFGESADAATQFQSGAHIRAEGNVVIKEALSSDHWQKYNMTGIFTVTKILEVTPQQNTDASSAKINIDAVCDGALAYMTFPNGDAAAKFVAECKEGKHPEVLEKYKADMNLGDGKAI